MLTVCLLSSLFRNVKKLFSLIDSIELDYTVGPSQLNETKPAY